jgi:hypothetical protein
MFVPFHHNLHHLDEVMRFDKDNGIPSTFFFGMAKGLGMSYNREKALSAICRVQNEGFETGVHGIAYNDAEAIKKEYAAYREMTGCAPRGIRMHYVRYPDDTFSYLEQGGICTILRSLTNSRAVRLKLPIASGAVGVPVTIMDTYLPYDEQKAKRFYIRRLKSG